MPLWLQDVLALLDNTDTVVVKYVYCIKFSNAEKRNKAFKVGLKATKEFGLEIVRKLTD